jgi:hypothetical protein
MTSEPSIVSVDYPNPMPVGESIPVTVTVENVGRNSGGGLPGGSGCFSGGPWPVGTPGWETEVRMRVDNGEWQTKEKCVGDFTETFAWPTTIQSAGKHTIEVEAIQKKQHALDPTQGPERTVWDSYSQSFEAEVGADPKEQDLFEKIRRYLTTIGREFPLSQRVAGIPINVALAVGIGIFAMVKL